LARFDEIVGPIAAGAGKSEVGASRHCPGRLKHRGDLDHKPCLHGRDRIPASPELVAGQFAQADAGLDHRGLPTLPGAWRRTPRIGLGSLSEVRPACSIRCCKGVLRAIMSGIAVGHLDCQRPGQPYCGCGEGVLTGSTVPGWESALGQNE
jgi:hypothetical protein